VINYSKIAKNNFSLKPLIVSQHRETYTMNEIDTRIVKASFRDCPVSERKNFLQSSCIIPISVGQAVHEGKKFLATIKLIDTSFKKCTILIDDSVQRHTMKIDNALNDGLLYQMAIKEGDGWLQRNKAAYKKLTIPYDIMRWDDWLTSPDYKNSYEKVKNQYYSHENYRQGIQANIEEFLARYIDRFTDKSQLDYERAFSLCLDYLLEECAVMRLWVQREYEFEVYPSGRNKAMAATYEYLIKPSYPNFLRSVALRFKKYPGQYLANQSKPDIRITDNVFSESEMSI
jgi:hypothetical protein